MTVRGRVEVARRDRELAGSGRSGRYARRVMWERNLRFVKRGWWVLVGMVVIVVGGTIPFALTRPEEQAWFLMGFAVATATWLGVLAVILFSGAVGSYTGVIAEMETATELRRLRRHGWRLVNGLVLRGNADIDHIAVGPAGVLVVETKHSDEPWPVGTDGDQFMADRLAAAIEQVRRNAADVSKHFNRSIGTTPVRAILVVDSSQPPAENAPKTVERERVTIVGSRHLRTWLASLDGHPLDEEGIDRIWTQLSRHAERRERADEQRHGPPRPTLTQIGWRVLLEFPLGLVLAFYIAIVPAAQVFGDWSFAVTLPFAVTAGLAARRVPRLRWFAAGWLLGCAITIAILVVVAARFVIA